MRDHERLLRSAPAVLALCALSCSSCTDPASASAVVDGGDASTAASPSEETDAAASESGGASADDPHDPDPPPVDLPTDGFLGGFFPIGVFGQPAYAMEGWADIGCNTMLSVPQGESIEAWDEEAQRLGMAMIRQPLGAPSQDRGRTDLLAWLLPDEPDVEINNAPCGGNCVDLVESLSAQWRDADPTRKIFVNVAGPNVLLEWSCDYCNGPGDEPPSAECFPNNDQCYPRIFDAADWVSQDIYPVTGWLPSEHMRDDVTVVGQTLDRIRDWTDKPLFAIVEVSDQRLGFEGTGARGPTAHEYRAEVWHAIIHGARGIFYFPQAFNPFDFEAVAPDVLDEMIVQHDLIADLGALLQAEADPSSLAVSVEAPLEATWRQTEHDAWVFVLETSGQPGTARIAIEGVDGDARVHDESRSVALVDGGLTDEFLPYELHVYVLPRAAGR
jgi:hypothetical protein